MHPTAAPTLVWNKGIAARCDCRIPNEFRGGEYVVQSVLAGAALQDSSPADLIAGPESYFSGDSPALMWVRMAWLKSFSAQVLPRLHHDIVLVTGDSDQSVPSQIPGYAQAVLDHPNVLHWFAQNCDAPSHLARISPLPIGIDFHTLSERPYWGEPMSSPAEQERELLAIARQLPPVERRLPKVYLDFTGSSKYGQRHAIVDCLLSNPLAVMQARRLPRSVLFRQRGAYAFVLSPHGNGIDCHRTWEALALGHIVLVPQSPLDALYEGLPVVSIRDWSEVTKRNLSRWLDLHGRATRDNPRITSNWWIARMRAQALGASQNPAGS